MDSDSIEIKESKFGKGLFATKDIEPGTVLCKVSGNEKELNFYETTLLGEKESHAIQIDFGRYLLCEPPFLYSNHSCNPNCGVNENLELFALTTIKAGEELFWDYSTSMLERHWTMKCWCGEKDCRQLITDFDLLPTTLQLKYLKMNIVFPFIAHFIKYHRAKSA
ncbi:MAG TPA: SET domain-containing protein [Flavisolibacter sp.]|jgi:uncharacterized protein|nr:SET domain-containing protein [Flavisolibacter sp.]